ncbi:MAG TPA: DUF3305 domain-containing protein [Burkholderiaceae bacterium]|nr:DUF3305 domain-containing protein [Burkholderiaceae bacterium]
MPAPHPELSPVRPAVQVAVVMAREAAPNAWEDWRFRLVDVVPAEPAFGTEPRVLRDDGKVQRKLFPGFTLELFRDEAEGYHLNLASGSPVWFVVWRTSDEDPSLAWPETVSLSYTEAGRWLDAQERVDNVPLHPDLVAWLQAYTDAHYRPEPKKRRRPQSFLAPGERL